MRRPESMREAVQRLRLACAWRSLRLRAIGWAVSSIFAASTLTAQPAPAVGSAAAPRAAAPHANGAAGQGAASGSAQPAQPAPAPMPDWPANDRPSSATVTWDSHGLSIVAANSSLSQILHQVSTETGATLEGLSKDERIFGVYGPGQARDVISQLLDGSSYNVLMVGDVGQGTPRHIILLPRSSGETQPASASQPQTNADDEDAEPEQQAEQPESPPPPPPQQPPPPNSAAPAMPVRSQQELIQELQQRQQQAQQQPANPQ